MAAWDSCWQPHASIRRPPNPTGAGATKPEIAGQREIRLVVFGPEIIERVFFGQEA
jgi:hypothetical protein